MGGYVAMEMSLSIIVKFFYNLNYPIDYYMKNHIGIDNKSKLRIFNYLYTLH